MNTPITRKLLTHKQRQDVPVKLFGGLTFPFLVEPTIFNSAALLVPTYRGGYWEMVQLSNEGFYMAPANPTPVNSQPADTDSYAVTSPNGYEGQLTPDALGICACLYAYSYLSFPRGQQGEGEWTSLQETCSHQYHLLREYAMDHPEALKILAVID